jgi:ferredoxin
MSEEKYTIEHEKWKCIGCWACANVTPEYWEMEENDDSVKSKIKGCKFKEVTIDGNTEHLETVELEKDYDDNLEAARVCPVNCIHIIEEDGEKVI